MNSAFPILTIEQAEAALLDVYTAQATADREVAEATARAVAALRDRRIAEFAVWLARARKAWPTPNGAFEVVKEREGRKVYTLRRVTKDGSLYVHIAAHEYLRDERWTTHEYVRRDHIVYAAMAAAFGVTP